VGGRLMGRGAESKVVLMLPSSLITSPKLAGTSACVPFRTVFNHTAPASQACSCLLGCLHGSTLLQMRVAGCTELQGRA
jgi:hypothetical protein